MLITVERILGTKGYTAGSLFIDNFWECYTLESEVTEIANTPVKEWKTDNSAIPFGKYQVIINKSLKTNNRLPLLLNVAGFIEVRIHDGDMKDKLDGGIIIGLNIDDGWISNTQNAMERVIPKIEDSLDCNETVFIEFIER